MLKRRGKPPFPTSAIIEPLSSITKITTSSCSTVLPSRRHPVTNRIAAMHDAEEAQRMMNVVLVHSDQGNARLLRARIDLHQHFLNSRRFPRAVLHDDGEGIEPEYGGSPCLEKLSCSCRVAGHQLLFVFVEHQCPNITLLLYSFSFRVSGLRRFGESALTVKFLSPMSLYTA